MGSFMSSDRMLRDYNNSLTSLSTDGMAKEGHLKAQPPTRPGLNLGPHGWCLETLPNALNPQCNTSANHAHTKYIMILITILIITKK